MSKTHDAVLEIDVSEALPVAPAITPMQMLNMAVQQGADLDKLEKLMALQERWEKTEARKAFVVALNAFKAAPPEIIKNKLVSFTTSKGKTEYKHATLDQVSGIIGAALAQFGISHRWEVEQPDGGKIRVTCVLTHSQGHSERVPLQANSDDSGGKNAIQGIGSTVTYLQRYTLLAATGMAVADHDDDGGGGQGEKVMLEHVKAGFLTAIGALADKPSGEALWQKVAAACQACGDISAYDELKKAMGAKMRAL